MAKDIRYLFVSYAREEFDQVHQLVEMVRIELRLRALPVEIWIDVANLRPGEQWDFTIAEALKSSIGFLFFVSPQSLSSEWVRHELDVAAATPDRLIIPVILQHPPFNNLPHALAYRQWLDLSSRHSHKDLRDAAVQIADATESYLRKTPQPRPVVSKTEAPKLAADIAKQVRTPIETTKSEAKHKSVFVVHGHNTQALAKLEDYLSSVGITAVVLSRQDESPQSLFQKFMSVATQASFAIVLLCADDYGAARRQYEAEGVGDKSLQFRARQNVVLELGFFYGRLGWESVFVVYLEPEQVFPNFERPSDLDGVVFDSMSDVSWQKRLGAKLSAAGFELSPST